MNLDHIIQAGYDARAYGQHSGPSMRALQRNPLITTALRECAPQSVPDALRDGWVKHEVERAFRRGWMQQEADDQRARS